MSEEGAVTQITTPTRIEYTYTPGKAAERSLRHIARGRLVGERCPSCRKVYLPPRGACARCGVATREEVEVADTGTITTFCVVRVPSRNIDLALPYVTAHILLDGADIPMHGLIQECAFDEVRMGMRVQAVWVPAEDFGPTFENIKYFRPSGEPDVPFEQFQEHL